MNDLLRRYIVEIIKESVPALDEDLNEDEVNEFSGVGAIAGFVAPSGLSGRDMEGPKTKERKEKKPQIRSSK